MQLPAVYSFEISININLKVTVDRYTSRDTPKGDSESVRKNLWVDINKIKNFDNIAARPSSQWDISIYINLKATITH